MASVSYAAAQQIGAMAVLTTPSYVIEGWHLAMIDWAVTLVAILCNTVFFRKLPLMEGLVMILHWYVRSPTRNPYMLIGMAASGSLRF